MRTLLFLLSFGWLLPSQLNAQRIINRILYIFPLHTEVDTLRQKFPARYVLDLNAPLKDNYESRDSTFKTPKDPKGFFKPSPSDILFVDSLLKADMLQAYIAHDSLQYLENGIYTWYHQQPTEFYKYKEGRMDLYERQTAKNRRRIRRSDRYYFGYHTAAGVKRVVVLFDPKKIKKAKMGDIVWFDECEPFVVDLSTGHSHFGYFSRVAP